MATDSIVTSLIIFTTGFIILLSTLTKTLRLPYSFSLNRLLSNNMVKIVQYGIIILFSVWIIYTIYRIQEPYTNSKTFMANKTDPSMGISTPTIQYDANPNNSSGISASSEIQGGSAASSAKEEKQQNFKVDTDLVHGSPLYNEPGSFLIGGSGFVPNYEQSVYLNQTTNLSQVTPITDAPYISGGFCQQYIADPGHIEMKCNSLDKDVCGSTDCCVLFGGSKCVHGNEHGPTIRTIYSDFTLPNRDYYYYKGKCYGNCPN